MKNAKELFDEAQAGQKLSPADRRHVIGYLQGTADNSYTNNELAKIFQISEGQVRQDKIKIRKKMIDVLQQEHDVENIITDILIDYNKVIKELEKGLKEAKKGRMEHLKYTLAIMDVRLKVTEVMQNLGWYPKNLGTIQEKKWEWITSVGSDGTAQTVKKESITEKTNKPELPIRNITPEFRNGELPKEDFKFITSSEEDNADRTEVTTSKLL